MQEVSKYTVFNIREYLNGNNEELGEDDLRQVLSEFSCEKNPDVERFAKEQSIEFAKKQQSVTYLVFSTEDAELVVIIPGLFEPPVRTLRATIPENESHIFR